MRELHIASVADDGSHLVLAAADGESFTLRVDEHAQRIVRELVDPTGRPTLRDEPVASPRPSPPAEDTALTPRDIQARVRAGATVEEVAREAGTDPARVLAYARPVLAERTHIAEQAGAAPFAAGTLGLVVADRLTAAGADPGLVEWDAHLDAAGGWLVTLDYQLADSAHVATWSYRAPSRSLEPIDDGARWFAGVASATPLGDDAGPPRREASKRRASVPKWDDILLGEQRRPS